MVPGEALPPTQTVTPTNKAKEKVPTSIFIVAVR